MAYIIHRNGRQAVLSRLEGGLILLVHDLSEFGRSRLSIKPVFRCGLILKAKGHDKVSSWF
jgi:hypothetical protein